MGIIRATKSIGCKDIPCGNSAAAENWRHMDYVLVTASPGRNKENCRAVCYMAFVFSSGRSLR